MRGNKYTFSGTIVQEIFLVNKFPLFISEYEPAAMLIT